MSPGHGRMARAASLASSRCAKGAQQMLSEESDLSHFAHSHCDGLQLQALSVCLDPGFMRVCGGNYLNALPKAHWAAERAVLLWAQQAQLAAASSSGTEEVKHDSENTCNCIAVRSHQW